MRIVVTLAIYVCICIELNAQGLNHHFLFGYAPVPSPPWTTWSKSRAEFDVNNIYVWGQDRIMTILDAQATISDSSGHLLFYTNGCEIHNKDTVLMKNGDSLTPGDFADGYCHIGVPGYIFPQMQVILPKPNEQGKFILIHETGELNAPNPLMPLDIFYSEIDMSLDSGRGEVIIKNQKIFSDTLCAGIAACKHANGRDWWVSFLKDESATLFIMLITPTGVDTVFEQNFNLPHHDYFNFQMAFSPNGKKFAYTYVNGPFGSAYRDVRIFDFDRCTGLFSNANAITFPSPNNEGYGLAWSPNSKYLYICSYVYIWQFDTDDPNIASTQQLVATYDGYCTPGSSLLCTNFWYMYLAADGRIYITSNAAIDLNVINSPDSAGLLCDVQQHAKPVPSYTSRHHVNHPNYYLGCDTTFGCGCATSFQQSPSHDFQFRVYPNPLIQSKSDLHIGYLLPQYKSGFLRIMDYTGKIIVTKYLPPFTVEQSIKMPLLVKGIYLTIIESGNYSMSKKVVVLDD